jgi:hypothetical protein
MNDIVHHLHSTVTACVFELCILILNVESTRKYYARVTIFTEHRETNVYSGHRVRMCNVLCLHIKHTAVQVLGAILRLKTDRQIGSAILFSCHMFSPEFEVCYILSTTRIIGSLHLQPHANFIFLSLCKHSNTHNSGTL